MLTKLSSELVMKIRKTLEQFGLTKKEVATYIACLELGEALIPEIAKKSNLPRTTVYGIMDSLVKNSLVSFLIKRKKKYFIAESPEKLLGFAQERARNIKEIIPRLKSIYNVTGSKPKIRFYESKEGIRTILNDILDYKRHFLATTSIEDMNKLIQDYFYDFIKKRIRNNLKVKLLTNCSPNALELKKTDAKELRETRFVPAKYCFKTANFIYGDRVAILSLGKNPMGIIIEDSAITATQKMYFEIAWQNGEKCELE